MRDLPLSGRYHRFSQHLKQKFGARVYKISLDAGLSCPNRDGTLGRSGCIFCDAGGGSGRSDGAKPASLTEQIITGKEGLRRRYGADKFIAYLQTYTNTYGDIATLKHLYDEATASPDIVGLSIATRPDCIEAPVLDLIAGYSRRYDTWIELGVQSMHDDSLKRIDRGHDVAAVRDAVLAIKQRDIRVCAHLILGLPGETRREMIATAHRVTDMGVDAVKLHMLYVARHSRLAELYRQGSVSLLSQEEYVDHAVAVLENLAPSVLIQRLVSEAHPEVLLAPLWLQDKSAVIQAIEDTLESRDTYQGRCYPP